MNKTLILDFNRTLYDPDTHQLIDGALELIETARSKGYTLVLLAQAVPTRASLISDLGIADSFAEIILAERKMIRHIRAIEKSYQSDPEHSYLLGDRATGEIALGHRAGWQTIWYQAGRFAAESPIGFSPTHTIQHLSESLSLL